MHLMEKNKISTVDKRGTAENSPTQRIEEVTTAEKLLLRAESDEIELRLRVQDGLERTEDALSTIIDKLKSTARFQTRIHSPALEQSVLEHLGAVTLYSLALSEYAKSLGVEVNTEKVLKMAVLHDVGEVVTSDMPHTIKYGFGLASDKLREALHEIEDDGMQKLLADTAEIMDPILDTMREERGGDADDPQTRFARLIVKFADVIDALRQIDLDATMNEGDLRDEIESRHALQKKDMASRITDAMEK